MRGLGGEEGKGGESGLNTDPATKAGHDEPAVYFQSTSCCVEGQHEMLAFVFEEDQKHTHNIAMASFSLGVRNLGTLHTTPTIFFLRTGFVMAPNVLKFHCTRRRRRTSTFVVVIGFWKNLFTHWHSRQETIIQVKTRFQRRRSIDLVFLTFREGSPYDSVVMVSRREHIVGVRRIWRPVQKESHQSPESLNFGEAQSRM